MIKRQHLLRILLLVVACAGVAPAWSQQPVAALGPGFQSRLVAVDGAAIHAVVGGTGPAVVLVHGFPQDWTEFRSIMPRLARRFTVVAVDLRGIGESRALTDRFDAATMAADIHQVVGALGLAQPYIVGHDIGGQVAYAYALQFGDEARGVLAIETFISGPPGTDALDASPFLWHVRFMQVPEVSEQLIAGRHDVFPGVFLRYGDFSAEDRRLALAAYERDDQMQAMLKIYRAFPQNAKFNVAHRTDSRVPVLFVNEEHSPFNVIVPATLDGARAAGLSNVRAATVSGGMHFLFADTPERMAELIETEGR